MLWEIKGENSHRSCVKVIIMKNNKRLVGDKNAARLQGLKNISCFEFKQADKRHRYERVVSDFFGGQNKSVSFSLWFFFAFFFCF